MIVLGKRLLTYSKWLLVQVVIFTALWTFYFGLDYRFTQLRLASKIWPWALALSVVLLGIVFLLRTQRKGHVFLKLLYHTGILNLYFSVGQLAMGYSRFLFDLYILLHLALLLGLPKKLPDLMLFPLKQTSLNRK